MKYNGLHLKCQNLTNARAAYHSDMTVEDFEKWFTESLINKKFKVHISFLQL